MTNSYTGDSIQHALFLYDCKITYKDWNNAYNKSILSKLMFKLFWSKTMCMVSVLNNEQCLKTVLQKYDFTCDDEKFCGLNRLTVTNRNSGKFCYIYVANTVIDNINVIKGSLK